MESMVCVGRRAGWLLGPGSRSPRKSRKKAAKFLAFFLYAPFSEENVFSFRPSRSVTQSMEHMVHDKLTCALKIPHESGYCAAGVHGGYLRRAARHRGLQQCQPRAAGGAAAAAGRAEHAVHEAAAALCLNVGPARAAHTHERTITFTSSGFKALRMGVENIGASPSMPSCYSLFSARLNLHDYAIWQSWR